MEQLCSGNPLDDKVLNLIHTEITPAKAICDFVGGQLPIVESPDAAENVREEIMSIYQYLNSQNVTAVIPENSVEYWIGNTKNDTDGEWFNPYDLNRLTFPRTTDPGKPRCAGFVRDDFYPLPCRGHTYTANAVCLLKAEEPVHFTLNGLCDSEMDFDRYYYIHGVMNKRPHIRGVKNSHIYFDREHHGWILQSFVRKEKRFSLRENGEKLLPIGPNLVDDLQPAETREVVACLTSQTEKGIQMLSLTKCFSNQYTCNDGTCIDLE